MTNKSFQSSQRLAAFLSLPGAHKIQDAVRMLAADPSVTTEAAREFIAAATIDVKPSAVARACNSRIGLWIESIDGPIQ